MPNNSQKTLYLQKMRFEFNMNCWDTFNSIRIISIYILFIYYVLKYNRLIFGIFLNYIFHQFFCEKIFLNYQNSSKIEHNIEPNSILYIKFSR